MPISSQWLRKPFSSQEWRNVVRLRKRRECLAATHVTGELVGSFFDRTRLPLRAVPLGFDPSSVTAIANDFSYQIIFPRQLQALGKPGDILWAFSTSGNSPNVLAAMETAKNIGITTVLFES
jgi:D-sedoheptulose 7-phosphate isomerase